MTGISLEIDVGEVGLLGDIEPVAYVQRYASAETVRP